MGLGHSPRIVTNGLVLCLDAGNTRSYPGSGTTWTNLAGTGNNGTLTNGPTFSADNRGTLVFDGTNDYVDAPSASLTIGTTVTVSAWVRHNTLSPSVQRYLTLGIDVATIRYDLFRGNGVGPLIFYIKTDGVLRLNCVASNAIGINTWYHVVGTFDGTTMRLYKNGIEVATNTPGGTLNGGNLNYFVSSATETVNGNIAGVSVYDRALSAAEVSQNFNALRGRFGL